MMLRNGEIDRREEIGLVTPTLGLPIHLPGDRLQQTAIYDWHILSQLVTGNPITSSATDSCLSRKARKP